MKKVLILDDDTDILYLIHIVLSRNNFEVKAIANWKEVTNSITSFSPDLIMLDVDLPGADGREICKEIKGKKQTENIPIILCSAQYDLLNNTRGCNANGIVTKPFEISHLVETVTKILLRLIS